MQVYDRIKGAGAELYMEMLKSRELPGIFFGLTKRNCGSDPSC